MFLNRMMTTNWSWEPFVLMRGLKEGQIAPHPTITCFLSTRGGFGGPSEVRRHKGSSAVPPYSLWTSEVFAVLGADWQPAVA